MPVLTQLKAIIIGAIMLVLLVVAALIYWRGAFNATTKTDLNAARETIAVERKTLVVTTQTDTRVNAEGIQTATTAQEATREIEAIRQAARVPQAAPDAVDPVRAGQLDADAARVLQLAREARAAAVASGALLQPARAGAR